MKLSNLHSLILTMFLVAITACVTTPEEVPTSEDGPTYLPGGDANEIDLRAFSEEELEEAVPGESLEEAVPGESLDGASAAANCVYIQYCNAPGKDRGTICRLRRGCKVTAATLNECVSDAYHVCGKPVDPWYLY
jgi:hypothetical protein